MTGPAARRTSLPLPPPQRPADWQWRAACRGVDPELFCSPDRRDSKAADARARRAKRVCRPCPVQRPCLAAALRGGEHGLWGGLTEDERDVLLAAAGGDVDRAVAAEALRRGGPR